MSKQVPAAGPLAAPLAYRIDAGVQADAAQVAQAMAAVWHDAAAALTPIIGSRGLAALYSRCLHVAGMQHPWLLRDDVGLPAAPEPAALPALLARQSDAEAAAGASHFLQTFHDLLVSLIGPVLVLRLLRTAWGPPIHGGRAEDTTP
jgi:hypothetical protein